MTDPSQQYSIPFIHLSNDPQPKFILNPKAIQIIQSYNTNKDNMAFISICGDYRSGKSFLMNSLFFSKQGFKVSPTTQPCTKGINLWSKPISSNSKNVWILDTQGFGAIDRDQSYDVKIFLLTTLISSVMMYNSFGALDQNTINKLAGICVRGKEMDPTLGGMKVFWVLRDFSLKMENKDGRLLTPDEYLGEALDETGKEERAAINKVFTERYCVALVRPVIDQTALSQLSEIKFEQLRGEFVEEVYKLRKKMLSVVEGKVVEGMSVDGQNLGMFLDRYLELLNSNQIDTCISATWQRIVECEREKVCEGVKDKLRAVVDGKMDGLPLTSQEVEKFAQQVSMVIDSEMKLFSKRFKDEKVISETIEQLQKQKHELIDRLRAKNTQRILHDQKQALKHLFDSLEKYLAKQVSPDAQFAQKYLEKAFKTKDDYFTKFAKYMSKMPSVLEEDKSFKALAVQTKLMYFEQFYTQQKLSLPKLMGQFSQDIASVILKLNQQKKLAKRHQTQLKQSREQTASLTDEVKKLTDKLTLSQRSLSELQTTLDLAHLQTKTLTTKHRNEYSQLKTQYEDNIDQLKQTILALEKNFMTLKKQNELQKIQYSDKIKYLSQRNDLSMQKLQQSRFMHDKAVEQIKEQCDEKLKRAEDKYNDIQAQLLSERKKFTELNKSKKEEESELLQDLAEKNQKLLTLRREFVNVQHAYKQQLQMIIRQQKGLLSSEFSLQLQQKQHRLIVYEQKLQQCMIRLNELQETQCKYETLLTEYKLQTEEHQVLAVKYSEVVNRLKKSGEQEDERQEVFEGMKQKWREELQAKEEVLRRLKGQLKEREEEMASTLAGIQAKQSQQILSLKQNLQQHYQQTLQQKLTHLQTAHKQQRKQLHSELKESFEEVESLKVSKGKLQHQLSYVGEWVRRMREECEEVRREVAKVVMKYKRRGNQESSRVLEGVEELDLSTMGQVNSKEGMPSNTYRTSSNSSKLSLRQECQQLESALSPVLSQHRSQSQQLQDLKESFKQTIPQLESCQTHIFTLNTQIAQQQTQIKSLQAQTTNHKQAKTLLGELQYRLQGSEKENLLLKTEVQVRDDIYNKRQASIRDNVQLYKETIANLTEENQHLHEKATKLEIELNRFTDWQGDFLLNNKSSGSLQYLNQNQQADDHYSLSHKLELLHKENRKLKKQLYHHQELSLLPEKPKNPLLSTAMLDSTQTQMLQSLKKQNLIYKKRVEELRDRELKLLEEIKLIKSSEKHSSETKISLAREEFEAYRRRANQDILELEKKVDQLNQEKYKLKQEMLLMRQDRTHIMRDHPRVQDPISNKQKAQSHSDISRTSKALPSITDQSIEQFEKTIQSLRQQNLRLQSQLAAANAQLIKTKDEADKKLASLQVSYEEKIRQLEAQKARTELENQKNKTKYQHLLKVNNDLIVEVDNFKARANNQLTLKEKYKHKISSLFTDE